MVIMSGLKPCHHLNGNADRLFCRQLSFPLDIIFQSDALDQLHDHVEQPPVLSHVIDIYHVGMHQPRSRLRFA